MNDRKLLAPGWNSGWYGAQAEFNLAYANGPGDSLHRPPLLPRI